jgi:hypothetical protein
MRRHGVLVDGHATAYHLSAAATSVLAPSLAVTRADDRPQPAAMPTIDCEQVM